MPKKKLGSIVDKINMNIENFTWGKCLTYPSSEDRIRFCNILFQSKLEIEMCKVNIVIIKKRFCKTCCSYFVDSTNKVKIYLCNKQCKTMEVGTDKNKSWETCFQPSNSGSSIYPYCDKIFEKDFYQSSRCKLDFCNLCCISFDKVGNTNLSINSLSNCYKSCITSKNIL